MDPARKWRIVIKGPSFTRGVTGRNAPRQPSHLTSRPSTERHNSLFYCICHMNTWCICTGMRWQPARSTGYMQKISLTASLLLSYIIPTLTRTCDIRLFSDGVGLLGNQIPVDKLPPFLSVLQLSSD